MASKRSRFGQSILCPSLPTATTEGTTSVALLDCSAAVLAAFSAAISAALAVGSHPVSF